MDRPSGVPAASSVPSYRASWPPRSLIRVVAPQGHQLLLDGRLPGHRDEPVGDEACQHLRLEREGERPNKAAAGGHAPTGQKQRPSGCRRAPELGQRAVAHQVEHDAVPACVAGEVLPGVVHDVVGTERADQVHISGAAYAGHLRAERLGDLDGEGAHATGCPIDQDLLSRQVTSFVGRDQELQEVKKALERSRLVTLTGPGCGKTRLALEAARERLEALPDGVWLAELEAVGDPALVSQSLGAALGIREVALTVEGPARQPVMDKRIDYLATSSCWWCSTTVDPGHQPRAPGRGQGSPVAGAPAGPAKTRGDRTRTARPARRGAAVRGPRQRRPAQLRPGRRDRPGRRSHLPSPGWHAAGPRAGRGPGQAPPRPGDRRAPGGSLRPCSSLPAEGRCHATRRCGGHRLELYAAVAARAGALRQLSVFAGGFTLEAVEEVCGTGGWGRRRCRSCSPASSTNPWSSPMPAARPGSGCWRHWLRRLETEHDNFGAAIDWAFHSDPEMAVRLRGALAGFWLIGRHRCGWRALGGGSRQVRRDG
jgi:hypothetical protein